MTESSPYFDTLEDFYKRGLALMRKKNADYAGDEDPFKNFRNAQLIGLTVEQAILVRILDKLARIGNLLDKEAQVADETLEDTLMDCANYLNILAAYRKLS